MQNETISIEEDIVEQVEAWQGTDKYNRTAVLFMTEDKPNGQTKFTGIVAGIKRNVLELLYHYFTEDGEGKSIFNALNKKMILEHLKEL